MIVSVELFVKPKGWGRRAQNARKINRPNPMRCMRCIASASRKEIGLSRSGNGATAAWPTCGWRCLWSRWCWRSSFISVSSGPPGGSSCRDSCWRPSFLFTSQSAARAIAHRAVDFYSKGLARLEGRWSGQGVKGLEYLDLQHPYAADLDLFGEGSLFELMCTARTRAGEEALASWLLTAAKPEMIRERQAAVDELRPRLDLREDLELLGVEVRGGLDPAALFVWGQAHVSSPAT